MPPLSTQTYICSILVITDSRYTCETDLRTIDAHMIIAFEIILHSSIIKLSVALIALMDLSFQSTYENTSVCLVSRRKTYRSV